MSKFTHQKWFTAILGVVIAAVILIIAGGGAWYYKNKIDSYKPIESRSIPQVQKDETASWKTYKSNFDFEFKYPQNLEATSFLDDNQILINSTDSGWVFEINIAPNNGNLSSESLINNIIKSVIKNSGRKDMTIDDFIIKDITIGGMPAKKYINKKAGDYGDSGVAMIYNGNTIGILGDSHNNFDIFLSTFRFISKSDAIDTTNWKTYKNDQYGFSFKYPSEWNVLDKDEVQPPYDELLGYSITIYFGDNFTKNCLSKNPAIFCNGLFVVGVLPQNEDYSSWPNKGSIDNPDKTPTRDGIIYDNNSYNVVLINKGRGVTATYDCNNKDICWNIYDQILSTFKFIK